MSAPPFALRYTPEAEKIISDLQGPRHVSKFKKVRKALRLLQQDGPRHPGLHSHRYQSVPGPDGKDLWESYVENNTPSAWRIWWIYGPDADEITIVTIGPHP
ncbi:MAG TPA: hypothetical protein VFX16_35400 [Pseudonocardiaceae bacterium]|nr:hypothetical protein [Pseudonocardiaceae bacterium]